MAKRPLQQVTSTTPVAIECLSKTFQVARTDTTAFDAFVMPKGAVLAGAYVIGKTNSDAATTAGLSVGSVPGSTNEIINAHNLKTRGNGYYTVDNAGGSKMGEQFTSDTLIKAIYAETGTASTTGGPWLVKVEYYFPQSGYSW